MGLSESMDDMFIIHVAYLNLWTDVNWADMASNWAKAGALQYMLFAELMTMKRSTKSSLLQSGMTVRGRNVSAALATINEPEDAVTL